MLGEGFRINPPSALVIGGFSVYFYGIIIACGFLLALVYSSVSSSKRLDEKMDNVYDMAIWGLIFGVIGARLYYVLFYLSNYRDNWTDIFRIRDGGLAIYGGVIGAVIAILWRSKRLKVSPFPTLDIAGLGLLIGQSVGRWGNFFNREAYGYETDVFCKMGLTLNGQTIYVHPTFLYESLWNALGLVILHNVVKYRRRYKGQIFLLYLFWYGLGRTFIEGLRSDSLWLIPGAVRVSQLLAFLTMAAALVLHLVNTGRVKAGKKPLFGIALDSDGNADIMENNEKVNNLTEDNSLNNISDADNTAEEEEITKED